ncbi:hypothetical protein XA68_11865 [Ophiocordyceps unilateralis]|uniref:DNA/RNA-binding domain-containing protein n=1 Tax=Ophiocordyceps unilateralis TaxID=268505 RepID=A0A2A9PG07_OPHUN|nr:hypothetical protein XA68_11865 [Ophiocordyceps unilateralis]
MDRITKSWVHHLRKTARQETAGRGCCPLCDAEVQPDIDSFRAHVRADAGAHASLADDADIELAFQNVTLHGSLSSSGTRTPRKRPVPGYPSGADRPDDRLPDPADRDQRGNKRICSPPASVAQQRGSSPPTPGRSRDYERAHIPNNTAGRQLWSPDDDSRPKTPLMSSSQLAAHAVSRPNRASRVYTPSRWSSIDYEEPLTAEMIRQPETKPISHEQLVLEVKGIYAGLVMIEGKCIEYDSSQEANQLSKEQYHALIALHRSVLHEHHDFFLASQHPSASDALRRLATKYAMPARMWRHGIHSFLELLRHKLPESLEHMLTFIYIAYSMMALLYETVPAFEDTWIECLGDLGRYRMAIEDDDIRDREIWTGVSRYWYSKASDKSPATGRLYHHLAILARPNALQQLYYYNKSLCVPLPFVSARESVMTLFDPLLTSTSHQRLEPVDAAFVRVHGILFSGKAKEQLEPSMTEFLSLLDGRIGSARSGWLEAGYYVGISLSCSLLGFGDENNVLMRAMTGQASGGGVGSDSGGSDAEACADETFRRALGFATRAYEVVLRRWGDKNTLSCLHTAMVFLLHVSRFPAAMSQVEGQYPWKLTSIMLNYLLKTIQSKPRIDTDAFPGPEKEGEPPYPLPEDYALRGLLYAEDYFPNGWFNNERIDESDRYLEPPSKAVERQERILWIGRRLASSGKWLTWDDEARRFSVAAAYDVVLDDLPDDQVNVSEPEDYELSQDA